MILEVLHLSLNKVLLELNSFVIDRLHLKVSFVLLEQYHHLWKTKVDRAGPLFGTILPSESCVGGNGLPEAGQQWPCIGNKTIKTWSQRVPDPTQVVHWARSHRIHQKGWLTVRLRQLEGDVLLRLPVLSPKVSQRGLRHPKLLCFRACCSFCAPQ